MSKNQVFHIFPTLKFWELICQILISGALTLTARISKSLFTGPIMELRELCPFDKNNENLKYLNDVSGNLLQIFESKDITSNLETNVKIFMSETLCLFSFCRK